MASLQKEIARRLNGLLLRKKGLNPTRIVAASFGVIILMGTLVLALPAASRDGQGAGMLTALFTATSATCVTGLVVADTWSQWSILGQGAILAMIQMGGLGFMTVITLLSFALHRRIGLSERLIMVSTFNLNDMDGVVRVVRHALMGTFALEGVGAVLLSLRFVPEFGLPRGIWYGVFHAVSAFCNAGFDLLGGTYGAFSSLAGYQKDPLVLGVTGALVVAGGLGFFVWEDLFQKRSWKKLCFYSKMVLLLTAGLIALGGLYTLAAEYHNPATLGQLPFGEKALNALFQSITLRTAGYDAIGQAGLTEGTKALSILLMLIGGSSGSTAGGIKTATIGVLLLALRAGMAGREQVTVHGRSISMRRVLNAMTLVLVVLALFLAGSICLATVESLPYLDAAYEVASALGTVGLTTGVTPDLSYFSKGMLVVLMYLGRVGVLSFSIAFLTGGGRASKIHYPNVDIMIG